MEEKKRKVGRPPIENARKRNLSVRVSEQEYIRIKEYASDHNVTISEMFLDGLDLLYKKRP